ncbi:ABC transporter ATP-binding protein [Ulvibacter litoralis]|uniref:Peptide/nickel transport system ATP-binding protein n=1 Tax=Ulvibacter litoralis TaxID=227084 RepID=A0A1G7D4V5_9FLAO|nr:ABC transporter ATP-binding protein [Ulvibacter litoralis]GHC44860.1 ABC transporter ATP-binding protein [Ulvibacter litoralis]SDE46523.1 peptide/nickel transport system ATP-binding protein [Ulvibacter litoralis]
MAEKTLLDVNSLSISFGNKKNLVEVIHNISFTISENEILGIVGESGSGKSVSSMAIMGLLPKKTILKGAILFEGKNLLTEKEKNLQLLRGNDIAMIFQEPMSALNPSLRCGSQVSEILQQHLKISASEAKKETIVLFEKVKLPRPNEIFRSYPHQISGGQMQRVMIAMAIACKPKLLIADEPTTALDVTVQKEIMLLLKELQKETGMSLLFISHDLGLVSEIADRVLVMYKGDIVESGTVSALFSTEGVGPQNDYTKALLASRPTMKERLQKLPTIASIADASFVPKVVSALQRSLRHKKIYTKAPLLEVSNLRKEYVSNPSLFRPKTTVAAVNGVSFSIFEGETVGLVGESGCGKSTLGKTILQLEKATSGSIKYRGKEITALAPSELRVLRKEIQLIFQDPYSSLNPRIIIGEALIEPMKVHNIGASEKERKEKVLTLLKRVGLDETFFYRYPHELSGGQRQRVGIARTIVMEPKLVICDESVSALDISVQAQVLNLLNELKDDFGFTYLFISHDLAVVKYMADQLLVMNAGQIEEIGDADEIYENPTQEYTKKLIAAIPKGM